MANRSYLYSLSNRPTSYSDRPETISGLSEWNYAIAFSYRVLMSGAPQICASLISDGLGDEPADRKTRLHAISSPFEPGYARWKKLATILRAIAAKASPDLATELSETEKFLEAHRNQYLLLETVELDLMTESTEQGLLACVERELNACRKAGAAIDALPTNVDEAAARLEAAARERLPEPLDAFHGLVLDDGFDNTRDEKTEYPLGVSFWSEVLYFDLWNRERFEARG